MGMAIVVNAVVANICLGQDGSPELFEVNNRLVGGYSGKQNLRPATTHSYLDQQRDRRFGKWKMFCALLLRVVRRLDPDTAIEIEMSPARIQYLTNAGASQELQADRIGGLSVRVIGQSEAQTAV